MNEGFLTNLHEFFPALTVSEADNLLLLIATGSALISLIFSLIAISRAKRSKIGPAARDLDSRIHELQLRLDDFDGRWNTRLTALEKSHEILSSAVSDGIADERLKKKV